MSQPLDPAPKPSSKGKKSFPPYNRTDSPLNRSRAKARKLRNASAPPHSLPATTEPSQHQPPSPTSTSFDLDAVAIKREDEDVDLWAGSHLDLTIEEEEEILAMEARALDQQGNMVVDDRELPEPSPNLHFHSVDDNPLAPNTLPTSGVSQGSPFLLLNGFPEVPIHCPQPQHPPNYTMPDLANIPADDSHPSSPSPKNVPAQSPLHHFVQHADHPPNHAELQYPTYADSRPQSAVPRTLQQPIASSSTLPTTHPHAQAQSSPPAHSRRAYVEDAIDIDDDEDWDFCFEEEPVEEDSDDDDDDYYTRVLINRPHRPHTRRFYNVDVSVPQENWIEPTSNDPYYPLLNIKHPQLVAWPKTKKITLYVRKAGMGCPPPGSEANATAALRDDITEAVGPIPTLRITAPAQELIIPGDREPPFSYLMQGIGPKTRDALLRRKCISTPTATLFFEDITPRPGRFVMTLGGFLEANPKMIIRVINRGLDKTELNTRIVRLALNQPEFADMHPDAIVHTIRDSLRISIVTIPGPNNSESIYVHVFFKQPTTEPILWRTFRDTCTSADFSDPFASMSISVVHDWVCALCNSKLHLTEYCFLVTEPGWIVNPELLAIANPVNNNNNNTGPPPPAAINMNVRGGHGRGRGRGGRGRGTRGRGRGQA